MHVRARGVCQRAPARGDSMYFIDITTHISFIDCGWCAFPLCGMGNAARIIGSFASIYMYIQLNDAIYALQSVINVRARRVCVKLNAYNLIWQQFCVINIRGVQFVVQINASPGWLKSHFPKTYWRLLVHNDAYKLQTLRHALFINI